MRDSILRSRFPRILTIDNDFYETYMRDPREWEKVSIRVKMHQSIDYNGRVFQNEEHELYAVENQDIQKVKKRKAVNLDTAYYLVEDPMAGLRVVSMPRKNPALSRKLLQEQAKHKTELQARLLEEEKKRKSLILTAILKQGPIIRRLPYSRTWQTSMSSSIRHF
ncbi:hypothetical protein [Arcticibacter sp. MXS-1]|uniref:hypothetical protein n=1 Tax=Arcticibacter sp. MXS-1 TaxID=3341726 RepID=UPI0035A8C478